MNTLNADYLHILEQAGLAPSGHNTQPWRFAATDGQITIRPDFRATLPVVDPDNRELYISLGCALENLCLAAGTRGYRTRITQTDEHGIIIALEPAADITQHPLTDAIAHRRTNRSTYDGRRIREDTLRTLLDSTANTHGIRAQAFAVGSSEAQTLVQYVMAGNNAQLADPAFKAELLSWIRFNAKHVQATHNGISYAALGAPALPAFISRPIVRAMLNPAKQNRADTRNIASASHLILLTSRDNTVPTWIATGRTLQHLLLQLTRAGIAHAYLNQPCEVAPLRRQLQDETFVGGEHPQILLRIGYGKALPPAPRKPVADLIDSIA
ncbi:MAG: nitroreductase [Cardiobacteriaceae bacterium]|nr:nitroreductase [Cardiobacteriaceae bacterium]